MLNPPKKPKSPRFLYAILSITFVFSVGITLYLASGLRVNPTNVSDSGIAEITETLDVSNDASNLIEQEQIYLLPQYESEEIMIFPETEVLSVIRQEFLYLRAVFDNDDIVGRLWIEGTAIDYLVVQCDDNEFYLYHDIHRNPSAAGWVFMDYDVDLLHENHNIVIYGHNMRAGNMFHNLRFFSDYDFFRQHSIINFSTIYEDTQWKVFAFYTAHISFPYTHINYENDEQWEFMLMQFIEASNFDTEITLTADSRILTLSTCASIDSDMRYVLQAKLIQ